MLKNILSQFFIKSIFDYIIEGKKLELIKYNKSFQNILSISLYNYKLFSQRYIIYEENNKIVKEYNSISNKLIFEGEYSNKKRNGKGKIYNDVGYVIFEGEFLNGKKNGKGKEYQNVPIIFEGEYLNGMRNGKGRQFGILGKILFEGEYLKGKKWNGKGYHDNNIIYELINGKGYIQEYDSNGCLEYEGEYLNGERNGKGKLYDREYGFLKFEGEFLNGKKWTGKGYDKDNNILYELKEGNGYIKEYDYKGRLIIEGEYLNGQLNGKVIGPYFTGEYKNGEKNGKFKEYYEKDKLEFEGEYLNGEKNGKGKWYDWDGKIKFEGEYLYGFRRKGKSYIDGILEYEGEFLFYRKWNGKGYDKNGNITYILNNGNGNVKEYIVDYLNFEGEYINGKRNGKGKDYETEFEGEYLNDKKWNGKFKINLDDDGNKIFEGEYINGKLWNGKGYEKTNNNLLFEFKEGNGNIKKYINGNLLYEAEFKNGEINGKLRQYLSNGIIEFEGEYKNGLKNGKGKEYYDDGSLKFEGEYLNDKKNGNGKEYFKGGEIEFEGKYLNNEKVFGKEYSYNNYTNEELIYEGEFLNGLKHGKGKEYINGILIYDGLFLNGNKFGHGKEYNKNGELIYEGEYLNDLRFENEKKF